MYATFRLVSSFGLKQQYVSALMQTSQGLGDPVHYRPRQLSGIRVLNYSATFVLRRLQASHALDVRVLVRLCCLEYREEGAFSIRTAPLLALLPLDTAIILSTFIEHAYTPRATYRDYCEKLVRLCCTCRQDNEEVGSRSSS